MLGPRPPQKTPTPEVHQFEAQNAANVAGAEQELARLSDELQRSLQAEHSLQLRVQDRFADGRRGTTAIWERKSSRR